MFPSFKLNAECLEGRALASATLPAPAQPAALAAPARPAEATIILSLIPLHAPPAAPTPAHAGEVTAPAHAEGIVLSLIPIYVPATGR